MGVGVMGRNPQRGQIVLQGARAVAAFVVQIGQIEVRERVLGVHLGGAFIVAFGLSQTARVEIDGAQVDQRAGGVGVKLDGFLVGLDHFLGGSAGGLHIEAPLEPVLGFEARIALGAPGFLGVELQQAIEFVMVKIQQQLARLGFHRAAFQFHADFLAVGIQLQFGEGIFDAPQLPGKRQDGATDLLRRNAAGA